MTTVTLDNLKSSINDFLDYYPPGKNKQHPNIHNRLYALSLDTIASFIGPEWVRDNLLGKSRAENYLRAQSELPLDQLKHLDRTIALAEMFFNLQGIPGFDGRVELLKTSCVETAVGELEGARLIATTGLPFEFLLPTGVLGNDFDARVKLPIGEINCEMKCKLETTELSHGSILSTLNKARKQLPVKEPGIIFVKMPEGWVRTQAIERVAGQALGEFFRNTNRVGGLVFHWEEWESILPNSLARVTKYRPEYNTKSSFGEQVQRDCLARLYSEAAVRKWVRFIQLMG
jgi:hypothetical protein